MTALATAASTLIPAADGYPAGGDDEVLRRLVSNASAEVRDAVAAIEAGNGDLGALRRTHPEAVDIFAGALVNAYYRTPAVQARIGYSGPVPQPAEAESRELDELIAPVLVRGPIHRRPPQPDVARGGTP
jgi:hypothetical protein